LSRVLRYLLRSTHDIPPHATNFKRHFFIGFFDNICVCIFIQLILYLLHVYPILSPLILSQWYFLKARF